MKKQKYWLKILLLIFIGVGANLLLLGLGSILIAHLTIYHLETPRYFFPFISHPDKAIVSLFTGDTLLDKRIHDFYLDPKVQGLFCFFYLVITFKNWLPINKKETRKDKPELGTHGTSRFKTREEILSMSGADRKGFVLGKYEGKEIIHDIRSSKLNQFVAVFGGSGSGKSIGLVVPNVLHTAQRLGYSMMISDPKGEIYDYTKESLRELGYDILYFNLWDLKKSMRYNPLDYIDPDNPDEGIASISQLIISNTENSKKTGGDPFWDRAELNLLKSLIFYIYEAMPPEYCHMASVLKLGIMASRDIEGFERMMNELDPNSSAREAWDIFRSAPEKTRGNIIGGFGGRLQLWTLSGVKQLTATSDFNLNQLGRKKTALFLITRDADSTYDLLPSLLIEQTFKELYSQAAQNPGGKLSVPVRLFLDELGNIAPINNLPRRVGAMRGRGISCCLIFQSISQFKDRYGETVSEEILDSCNTTILLGTDEEKSKEYFSKKLGPTTTETIGTSESKSNHSESLGKSSSHTQRPLMTPDEIGRLHEDKLIVFQKTQFPMILDKNYCLEWENWHEIPTVSWVEDLPIRDDEELALPSINKSNFVLDNYKPRTKTTHIRKRMPPQLRKRPTLAAIKPNKTLSDVEAEKPKKKLFSKKAKKSV